MTTFRTEYSGAVSDLKLYEIQASRACNFIKFQARLESSRPHKLLRQQICWKGYLKFHILTMWTTPQLQRASWIFRIWLFLITFLYYDKLMQKTIFVLGLFHNMKYSITVSSCKCPSMHTCPVSLTCNPVPHTLTLEILRVLQIFLCPS